MDNPMNFFTGKRWKPSEAEIQRRKHEQELRKQCFMIGIYSQMLSDKIMETGSLIDLESLPPMSKIVPFTMDDIADIGPAILRDIEPEHYIVLVLKDGRVLDQFGFERDDLRLV